MIALLDCCFRNHVLLGMYGVADLQALSPSDMLATSLPGNFLHLAKADGVRERCNLLSGDVPSMFVLATFKVRIMEISKHEQK